MLKPHYRLFLFWLLVSVLLITLATPFWGLLAGLCFSLLLGTPFSTERLKQWHGPLLKVAVVLLGFGLNINQVLSNGQEGIGITALFLGFIAISGFILALVLKVPARTAMLISAGTAICGGSAIAAVSPIVKAKGQEISVALGIVFVLNAVALLLFPILGRWLALNEVQFAWWAAMAIHDTSSVVGAAAQFGDQSLALATTLKLTRALWIIPVSVVMAIVLQAKEQKFSIPYFIFFFVLAALLSSYVPVVQGLAPWLTQASKVLFTLVLFLIGLSLNKAVWQEMKLRTVAFGLVLWLITAGAALLLIYTCCSFSRV